MNARGLKTYWYESHPAAVQLASRKYNHPEASLAAVLLQAIAHPDSQRACDEHSQQLQADNCEIGASPTLVGPGVLPPKRTRQRSAIGSPIYILLIAEEKDVPREIFRTGQTGSHQGTAAEEAVPQVATLEEEVDESIGGMPDEQEARLIRGRRRKELAGGNVADSKDGDGSKEGPDGRRTDKCGRLSGFQWVRHVLGPI